MIILLPPSYLRRMQWMKWISCIAAISLIIACFFPWIVIPGKDVVISGVNAANTTYGKPGYLNLLMAIFYLILTLIPRLWARRINLVVAVINLAWTLRNFLLLSRCEAGDCPDRQPAFFIFGLSALIMMIGALTTPAPPAKED